jgi:hypothetical protein
MTLTQARVRELFNYVDGALIYRTINRRASVKIGQRAGYLTVNKSGHVWRMIGVDGAFYPASRIVWLWHKGEWPKAGLDHIDQNGANDRIENLRECTVTENNRNSNRRRNRAGARGVYPMYGYTDRYTAQIRVNNRTVYLGAFYTVEEASAAYMAARLKYFGPEFGKLPWRTPTLMEGVP